MIIFQSRERTGKLCTITRKWKVDVSRLLFINGVSEISGQALENE
jgi:hypothetical protein